VTRALAAGLAACLLLLSACGSGGSGDKPVSATQTAAPEQNVAPTVPPGDLHTAEGREVARVTGEFYTALEDQDTEALCDNITPDARKKVIAIGSIQDAKTCQTAYTKIFEQLSFHYTQTPKVVRVTISGKKARATTMFGSHTIKAPLLRVGTAWKVNSIG
jgi:hypothetical protein